MLVRLTNDTSVAYMELTDRSRDHRPPCWMANCKILPIKTGGRGPCLSIRGALNEPQHTLLSYDRKSYRFDASNYLIPISYWIEMFVEDFSLVHD